MLIWPLPVEQNETEVQKILNDAGAVREDARLQGTRIMQANQWRSSSDLTPGQT